MTTPRKDSDTPIPATYRGVGDEEYILKQTGTPAVFAKLLKETSQKSNIAFAIRGGLPFQRYMMPCAPKPVSVKAKTGNWGFTKGVIAENNALGKVENKNDKWVIKPREEKDLPKKPGIVEPIVHKLSLREVLAGIETGEYKFLNSRNGRVTVAATDAPTGTNFEFSINLVENKARIDKQLTIPNLREVNANIKEVRQPRWWNDKWGQFSDTIDSYFPAQVRDANNRNSQFEDIKVLGVPTAGKVLPITGDQDLLWISKPATQKDVLGQFSNVYNTFDSPQVEELVLERIKMVQALSVNDPVGSADKIHDLLSIKDSSIARLGCITAFESQVIDDVNKSFGKVITHMQDLFQHGAENRNPGAPSPLDAPMVHVWRGAITLTNNEKELVSFVMQKGYLENNIIDVHPKWDMNQWSKVIERQFQLKHPVPPLTMAAYVDHQQLKAPSVLPAIRGSTSTMAKILQPDKPSAILQKHSRVPTLPQISLPKIVSEQKSHTSAAETKTLEEDKPRVITRKMGR